jgi:type IV pilus assembly protein PilM
MGLFSSNEITGIDIGAGSIKIVRVAGGRRPKLLSAELMELPLGPAAAGGENVGRGLLLSRKKLKGRPVVTQLSGRSLTVRHITLPRMPEAELRESVRWESKRLISYPLDAALVEYLIVGKKLEGAVEKYDILVVAAPRTAVLEHLKPFNEAGIKVAAVDANALALRNVLRLRKKQDGENILYIDLGAGKTELDIFKDGNLRFSRYLETGGLDITRAVADLMGTELQEAEELKQKTDVLSPSGEDKVTTLVRNKLDEISLEVWRSVEYYKTTFREPRVERMVLTGGGSLMTGIGDYLSRSFEGAVELDAPLTALAARKKTKEQLGPISPRFSSAIGLALRRE